MVGGAVEYQHVALEQHHAREHTAHLFAARKHVHGLENVVAAEKHSPEKSAEIAFGLVLGILPHPVDYRQLAAVEKGAVVVGEIAYRGRAAPFEAALVRLKLLGEYAEQSCHGYLVRSHKGYLVATVDRKADIVKHLYPVNRFGQPRHLQDILAHLALNVEAYIWIFT